MKLLVTKINNASKVNELAKQFYCKAEAKEDEIIITKNSELTDNEFSVLAGKLVMTGFNVELLQNNKAILDAVHQAAEFPILDAVHQAAEFVTTNQYSDADARTHIRRILQQAIDNGHN